MGWLGLVDAVMRGKKKPEEMMPVAEPVEETLPAWNPPALEELEGLTEIEEDSRGGLRDLPPRPAYDAYQKFINEREAKEPSGWDKTAAKLAYMGAALQKRDPNAAYQGRLYRGIGGDPRLREKQLADAAEAESRGLREQNSFFREQNLDERARNEYERRVQEGDRRNEYRGESLEDRRMRTENMLEAEARRGVESEFNIAHKNRTGDQRDRELKLRERAIINTEKRTNRLNTDKPPKGISVAEYSNAKNAAYGELLASNPEWKQYFTMVGTKVVLDQNQIPSPDDEDWEDYQSMLSAAEGVQEQILTVTGKKLTKPTASKPSSLEFVR